MPTSSIRQPKTGPPSCGKKAKAPGRSSLRISSLPSHRNHDLRRCASVFRNRELRRPSVCDYGTQSMSHIVRSPFRLLLSLLLVFDAFARPPIPPPTTPVRAPSLALPVVPHHGTLDAIGYLH